MVLGGESVQFSVLQNFLGLFMATCGGAGFFLFTDPNDSAVENPDGGPDADQSLMLNVTLGAAAPMGLKGDGASNQFQLARAIGMGVDILQNVSNVAVFLNGNALNTYAVTPTTGTGIVAVVSTTGVVTFQQWVSGALAPFAPPLNAVLTWQGQFQYLCQFTDDTLKDLGRVSKNSGGWLWSCGSIDFESVFA
jgi:hypothetical protein